MIINMSGGGKPEKRYKEVTVTEVNIVNLTPSTINNYYLDSNNGGTSSGNLYFAYISLAGLDFTPSRIRCEVTSSTGTKWVEEKDPEYSSTAIQRMRIMSDGIIQSCTRTGGFYSNSPKQVMFYANEKLTNATAVIKCWE